MFNVILDEFPDSWEGYQINSDFRIGIQIYQVLEDKNFTDTEKHYEVLDLLFPGICPEGTDLEKAIMWFMGGWKSDKPSKSKDRTRVIDYDVDQWRIYSAFKEQYGIDLNTENMHYWKFMGLLTNLNDCAFTKVVDLRMKKINSKMSKEEKDNLKKAKEIYALEQPEEQISEDEKQRKQEAVEQFEKMRKAKS